MFPWIALVLVADAEQPEDPTAQTVLTAESIVYNNEVFIAQDVDLQQANLRLMAASMHCSLSTGECQARSGILTDGSRKSAFEVLTWSQHSWSVQKVQIREGAWVISMSEVGSFNDGWSASETRLEWCPCPNSLLAMSCANVEQSGQFLRLEQVQVYTSGEPWFQLPRVLLPKHLHRVQFPQVSKTSEGLAVSVPMNIAGQEGNVGLLAPMGPYLDASLQQNRFLLGYDVEEQQPVLSVFANGLAPTEYIDVEWRWRTATHPNELAVLWRDSSLAKMHFFPMETWFQWNDVQLYSAFLQNSEEHRSALRYQPSRFWKGGGGMADISLFWDREGMQIKSDLLLQHGVRRAYWGVNGQVDVFEQTADVRAHLPFYGDLGGFSYVEEIGVHSKAGPTGVATGPSLLFYGQSASLNVYAQGVVYIVPEIQPHLRLSASHDEWYATLNWGDFRYAMLSWHSGRTSGYASLSLDKGHSLGGGFSQRLFDRAFLQTSVLFSLEEQSLEMLDVRWRQLNRCDCFGFEVWGSVLPNGGAIGVALQANESSRVRPF